MKRYSWGEILGGQNLPGPKYISASYGNLDDKMHPFIERLEIESRSVVSYMTVIC
jgi:hypothetical protein